MSITEKEILQEKLDQLHSAGISLKANPGLMTVLGNINRTKRLYTTRRINKIGKRGRITTEKYLTQLALLTDLACVAVSEDDELFYLCLLYIARITLRRGSNPYELIGFAGYAHIADKYLEEEIKAEKLYELSLQRYKVVTDGQIKGLAAYILGSMVGPIYGKLNECLDLLGQGIGAGSIVGSPNLMGMTYLQLIELSLISGQPLPEVRDRIKEILELDQSQVRGNIKDRLRHLLLMIDTLIGPEHEGMTFLAHTSKQENLLETELICWNLIRVEDWKAVISSLNAIRRDARDYKNSIFNDRLYFIEGIAMVGQYLKEERSLSVVSGRLKQIKTYFSNGVYRNPDRNSHCYKLISGLQTIVTGNVIEGEAEFEEGIEMAGSKGYSQDIALSYWLYGQLCHKLGMDKRALYNTMEGANYLRDWGMEAIALQLEDKWQLSGASEHIEERWLRSDLDFEQEVHLESLELIEKFEPGMVAESLWQVFEEVVRKQWKPDKMALTVEGSWPVEEPEPISTKGIQQVMKHGESAMINSYSDHPLVKYDAYLMDHGHICVAIIPLIYMGESFGALYIERKEDFTKMDISLLPLFCEQISYLYKSKS